MAVVEVLRKPPGRVKHGEKTFEPSHEIENVDISYADTLSRSGESDANLDTNRESKIIDAVILIPHGSNLTAQDRIQLPDDTAVYRILGKPLPRRNGRTGTVFKTRVELQVSEG